MKNNTVGTPGVQDAHALPVTAEELMQTLGGELGSGLTLLEQGLVDMYVNGNASAPRLKTLIHAAMRARRAAMTGQQVGRLLGGRLRQSHERLSLKTLLESHLAQRSAGYKKSGIQVKLSIKPVEVIVDPGLLTSLVDAALDWAAERGKLLIITLGVKNWPHHAQLYVKARPSVTVHDNPEGEVPDDSMVWLLLRETARIMGVSVQRLQSPEESTVILEFANTVREEIEGLTTMELESDFHSSGLQSLPLAGYRILFVSNDAALRVGLRDATRGMGLNTDSVATVVQAVQYCEMEIPHLIVVDDNIIDSMFEELRGDLLRQNSNFPFIEISDQSNAFEMSAWTQGSYTRIHRDAVHSHLQQALTFEMARVI